MSSNMVTRGFRERNNEKFMLFVSRRKSNISRGGQRFTSIPAAVGKPEEPSGLKKKQDLVRVQEKDL